MDSIEFRAGDILVNGVRLVDLVRRAEMPFVLRESRERPEDFGPDEDPADLAGDYTGLSADYLWPNRHFLDEPADKPSGIKADGETMLLTCLGCGMPECWSLLARIELTEGTVRWSGFRNPHRDWDLSAVGPFTFVRTQYEQALHCTGGAEPD